MDSDRPRHGGAARRRVLGTKLSLERPQAAQTPSRLQSSGKWARYVAPETACPRADLRASVRVEEQVELCLLNYARGSPASGR